MVLIDYFKLYIYNEFVIFRLYLNDDSKLFYIINLNYFYIIMNIIIYNFYNRYFINFERNIRVNNFKRC